MGEEALKSLLERIHNEQVEWSEPIQPPIGAAALQGLSEQSRSEFGFDLPADYQALLQIADGVDYNGSMIYASQDRAYDEDGGYLYGFLEANRRFRDTGLERHLVLIGESGDDYYAFDVRDQRYGIFDKVSLTPFDRFDSCGALIRFVLEEATE
jgi:hypothetical protein